MAGNSLDTYVMDLRARTAKLETDLDKANKKIRAKMNRSGKMMAKDFTNAFKKVGAVIGVTAGLDLIRRGIIDTVATSSQLQTTADKLGLTTTALQELRYAGDQFNVAQNTTDMALQRFGRRLGEAAQGGGELKSTLEQYGIQVRDTEGKTRSMMDVLRDFSDVLANLDDVNEQNRISMKAFDSEGVAFGAILRDGAAGLAALSAEAHAFGQVLDAQSIKKLDETEKALKRAKGAWSALWTTVVAEGVELGEAMGMGGIANNLQNLENQMMTLQKRMDAGQDSNKGPGTIYAKWADEMSEFQLKHDVLLKKLVTSQEEAFTSIEQDYEQAMESLQSIKEINPDSEGLPFLQRRVESLRGALSDLWMQNQIFADTYPAWEAIWADLEMRVAGVAEQIGLTASETATLESLLNSAKTDAEKFRDKIELLGKSMHLLPDRAAEIQEAMSNLTAEYEKSLEPDKMDQLLATWEDMSDRMGSSLSEALISGEDALDNFLSRMLNKLAAAALETALIQPFLSFLGPIGGSIGGLLGFADGGDPPVGVPSIVGERGPELFVPKTAGTIIPNHALASGGGSTVFNIKQDLHFDVGLESVDSRIASAAPLIAQATEAQILDKQRRGRR